MVGSLLLLVSEARRRLQVLVLLEVVRRVKLLLLRGRVSRGGTYILVHHWVLLLHVAELRVGQGGLLSNVVFLSEI